MKKQKEFEHFSCKLEKTAAKMLEQINEETGLPKTTIAERAIREYFEKYKQTGKI